MELTFGARLRTLRHQAGLSQRDLAQRAHLDISYISKIENGRLPPPAADTIVSLCSILGVPAEGLLATTHKLPTDVEDIISASAAAQLFLREAQGLPDEQWQRLTRHLRNQKEPRPTVFPTRANASDLTLWANRIDTPGLLPELVRRLILVTVGDTTQLEMRSGEGTRYEGYDGILEAGFGNAFVPAGLSVWEMGVDPRPKRKADDDYAKRSADPLGIDLSQTTFVFVTPRLWAGKESWATDKRKTGPWRDVRVLDADNLEAWLALAPAVHEWISRLVGKNPGDVQDLESFWSNWREATQPPLSTELIISGRDAVADHLFQQLQAPPSALPVQADAQEEVLAFIAAVFELQPKAKRDTLFARTVVVHSPAAWQQMVYTAEPLVLLPTFASVETHLATRQGHHVLIPLGRETAISDGMVVLPRPSRQKAETALRAMGFYQDEASSMAFIAHCSLLSLRRQLALNPAVHQPAWAAPEQVRPLLPALLAGSWDETFEGDQNVLTTLAGRLYTEVGVDLVRYAYVSDPPVRQVGTAWLLASKEDAWRLLARFLTRQDLERFRQAISAVLATLDPALELPVEERWRARIMERSRPHSRFLREGLADTLALLATRTGNSLLGGSVTGQNFATTIVTQLLRQANDDRSGQTWISFADVLPLLAEAAPDAFLRALDTATTGADPVIQQLFTDQSGDSLTARSAHIYLLWALERLAWSPDYLSRAALLLARLTRLDPGGSLANRPGSSLRGIFVFWYPQTASTFEERLHVLDRLREQEPTISWKLMVALLPMPHETADPAAVPRWRDWKPEERETSFTYDELWRTTEALNTRLLLDMGVDRDRISDVVERVENLPPPLRTAVLDHLEALDPEVFDTDSRKAICAELREQIARHRRFSQAKWAMPSEDIDRLRAIHGRFKPEDMIQQVLPLFTASPQLLDEPEEPDMKKHEDAVYQAQASAAQRIYHAQGLTGLLTLSEAVEGPWMLGWVLGKSGLVEREEDRLLSDLGETDLRRRQLAQGYVMGRFQAGGWEWADGKRGTINLSLTPTQCADFFLSLPSRAETWDRLERLADDTINLYWTQFKFLVEEPADCLRAAEQLLRFGRAWRALDVVAHYLDKVAPSPEFVLIILEAAITTPYNGHIDQFLLYEISQLCEYLEQASEVDESRLAHIEWNFLPLFRYEKRPLKILHRQLARDPGFFVGMVSLAYRAADEEPHEADEQVQARARTAYDLLHSASVVPGKQEGELIDAIKLTAWVEEARQLLEDCKRVEVGDLCIGQLLSQAKPDADGVWPPKAIRDLLEKLCSEQVEHGIELAAYNARGVTWRGLTEGGTQERQMTERYHAQAKALQFRWPRSADILRRLAQAYEEEARMHDREAELRQSGW